MPASTRRARSPWVAVGVILVGSYAQASVVNSLNRQLSSAVGVAVFSAIVVAELGAVAPLDVDVDRAQVAYNRVFLVSAWTCVAGLIACLWLPGRRRMREHHRDRAAEQSGDVVESRLS